MRKFSIARLMVVIGLLSVFAAALRNASELWAGLVLGGTLLLLAVSILGVVHRRGPARAWWLGFALFGWGYLVLVQGPWFSEKVGSVLPTSQGIYHIHRRVVEQPARWYLGDRTFQLAYRLLPRDEIASQLDAAAVPTKGGDVVIDASPAATAEQPSIWKVAFAGASDYESFNRIGHCAFALLFGLVGAMISRRMSPSAKPTESPEHRATANTTAGSLEVHA